MTQTQKSFCHEGKGSLDSVWGMVGQENVSLDTSFLGWAFGATLQALFRQLALLVGVLEFQP